MRYDRTDPRLIFISENKLCQKSQIEMSKTIKKKTNRNIKLVIRSSQAQASKPKGSSNTESISSTASLSEGEKMIE